MNDETLKKQEPAELQIDAPPPVVDEAAEQQDAVTEPITPEADEIVAATSPSPSEAETPPLPEPETEKIVAAASPSPSEAGTPPPHKPEAGTLPLQISAELGKIAGEIADLRKSFDGKFRYDAKKDEIIDRQHKELEGFKYGVPDKIANQIIMDLIFEIDSTEKLAAHYENAEFSEANYKKMLKIFREFSISLCDILEKQGVMSYRSETGGEFDPKKQRSLKTSETNDPSLAKTVRAVVKSGFERANGIVRPEMVDVYVYKPSAEPAPEQVAPVPAETQSQPAEPQQAEGQTNQ